MNAAQKILVGGAALLGSVAAHAQAVDVNFSTVTGAVSVSAIITGILAIGVIKIAPNAVAWATHKLSGMFNGR